MKRIISCVLAISICLSSFTACSPKLEKYSTMFFDVFDTVVSVISYQPNEESFEEMSNFIKEKYTYYDKLFDIYNSYDGLNNIKTINDNAGIKPVEVSQEIIDLLMFSKEWYEKSNGKLNVAMGSVLREWHNMREEYEESGSATVPDIEVLREKAKYTDINCVEVDDENNTVFITDENVQLDVGAVAKGFATEMICDELNKKYDNYALSAGGNVKTHGKPANENERWAIGIENPEVDEEFNRVGGNIDVAYFNTDMSLVCSGGYIRFVVVDGERYHHLIDPETLFPAEIYRGVAIMCEDSGMADALSTSAFMMQPEEALEFINGIDGAECMLIENDGTIHSTEGIKDYLASEGITGKTK